MKIYTKKGDSGNTSLIGGIIVSKTNMRVEAMGVIDELNAHIGNTAALIKPLQLATILTDIQRNLFSIGASLAMDKPANTTLVFDICDKDIALLESEIDTMEARLPALKNFILPSGAAAVTATHIARSVCRRAERACVYLREQNNFIEPIILAYLNRLGDYLFVLARYIAQQLKQSDVTWKGKYIQ